MFAFGRRCTWLLLTAVVGLAFSAAPSTSTFSASMRTLKRHVRATGTVQPVEAFTVQVPALVDSNSGNLVLTKIVPSGTAVKPGDIVAEFDRTRLLETARDAKAKYEDLTHQVEQRKAQHRSDEAKRASDLQQAEADLAKARLELRKGGLLSEIDRLKAETRLDAAQAHVASLQKTAEFKRSSEAADLKVLELQRDRQRLTAERAEHNSDVLQIRAPIAGMAAHSVVWRRDGPGQPQEGDQLWPGQALMRIFSSSEMELTVSAGEPDGALLKPGTRAVVRLDAYPDAAFHAVFDSAAPVATSGVDSTLRTFQARFRLEERDPHLLPDLSAAVDIEVATEKAVLAVPRSAVRFRHGSPYVIRVDKGGAQREAPVALGAFDDAFVEITSGLGRGDEVVTR
jgi:HlyD family secretion protein